MFTTNLNDLHLEEQRAETDPTLGCRVAFPLYAATGAAASAVVYFEVPPGGRLGRHTDSAEEVLLTLVPAMVPHDIRTIGHEPVRIVGFFSNSTVVHRFFEYLLGDQEAVFVHGPKGLESLVAVSAVVPVIA